MRKYIDIKQLSNTDYSIQKINIVHKKPKLSLIDDEWVEYIKPYCLTIDDIEKMEQGDKLKVLVLDRNVYDIACEINTPNTEFTADDFFRQNTAIYIHGSGLMGKLE